MNLNISDTTGDVDFAAWGPFNGPTCDTALSAVGAPGCGSAYTQPYGNLVDCSYSTAANEDCYIPNGQTGEYYMLMVTNYSNIAGNISITQTNGTGATDCSFITSCFISSIIATPSVCDSSTNTFSVSGTVAFQNEPTTGTLIVEDNISGVFQTFNAPFTSPVSYTLTSIPSDGVLHSVHAYFSDSTNCEHFTSIASMGTLNISAVSVNSANDGICNGNIQVNVAGGQQPYSYIWNNGESTNVADSLCAGTYQLTVTDFANCNQQASYQVNETYDSTYVFNDTLYTTVDSCLFNDFIPVDSATIESVNFISPHTVIMHWVFWQADDSVSLTLTTDSFTFGTNLIYLQVICNNFSVISVYNFYGVFNVLTGIQVNGANSLQVFPVPAEDYINVITNSDKKYKICLVNTLGQTLLKEYFKNKITLSTKEIKSGVYFLKLYYGNKIITKKIVISK